MKVILEIPDKEIKEQLKENTYVVEGEGEKGSVDIAMLYTNGTLDFICVEGREHFVKLKYKILPDNATNGDMIKAVFPNCKDWKAKLEDNDGEVYEVHFVQLPNSLTVNKYEESWWNEPYKKYKKENVK